MATIWSNSRIKDTLNKIACHHKLWLLYATFTPIIFGFSALLFYLAEVTTREALFWMYVSLIAATSAGWWLWTMWVIKQVTDAQTTILSLMQDISGDLKDIKISVSADTDLTTLK